MTQLLTPSPNPERLSAELKRLAAKFTSDRVLFSRLMKELRYRGHAVITLFLSFPFLLPIPVPGLSTVLGAVIIICGVRIAFQWRPWIPRRWRNKSLSGPMLVKLLHGGERLMKFLERFIRPRGIGFAAHPGTIRACGVMIAVLGFLLSLPYPPGTNSPPASAILLLSIGVIERDALFVAFGIVDFVLNLALFTAITVLGVEGVKRVLHWLVDHWMF